MTSDRPFTSLPATERIAISLLAVLALVALLPPLMRLPLWLEQPNEGWNAIHAMHAFSRALYPAPPAYIINNYPPLWFYLTGALGWLTGDPILAGRAVALAAFFITAAAIVMLLRRMNASTAAAIVGALSFVVVMAGLLGGYVGLSEPQMLAHACVTSSVAMLVGTNRRSVILLAAIGVGVGIFVKPIVIALPLAATVWIFINRRHLLATWVATGAAVSLAGLAACVIGYGQPFITNLSFPRVLTLQRLATNLALISKPLVPLIAFAWLAARANARRNPAIQFAAFAIGAALLELVVFGGALGVSVNIVFDMVIASSIGLGLAFDRLADVANGMRWRIALIAALIVRVALGMPNPVTVLGAPASADQQAQQRAVQAVMTRLRALPGPVACEALSACIWAGHASEADLWKLRFETTLGSLDKSAFVDAVRSRRFSAVVTFGDFTADAADRNLPGLYAALGAWYEPPIPAGKAFLIFLRKPR